MSKRNMRDVAGILHFLTPQQMAEEIVRLDRNDVRWRWLVAQHEPTDLPIAQVVWKRGSDPRGEWVNVIDGADLTRHVDAALFGSDTKVNAADPLPWWEYWAQHDA